MVNLTMGYLLLDEATRGRRDVPVLVVEMIAEDQIRVETFPFGTPRSADFTSAALIYAR